MKTRATIANALWWLSSVPAWRRFKRALRDPETSQQAILKRLIAKSTDTAFGQTHRFKQIKDHADFRERVPIRDYSELEPWIDRIRNGAMAYLHPLDGATVSAEAIPLRGSFEAIGVALYFCAPRVPPASSSSASSEP